MAKYNKKSKPILVPREETKWYMCSSCGPDNIYLEERCLVHEYSLVNKHGRYLEMRDTELIERELILCIECGIEADFYISEEEMIASWREPLREEAQA